MYIAAAYGFVILVLLVFFRLIRIVPEQESYVVEQFGKCKRSLGSGFHLVIPGIQRVAYKHTLKEEVIDVDPQVCITSDNVQVTVDGILYLRVMDPAKASYGIDNYRFATAQLAKTTMRSEIGKLELDRTFSERDSINDAIVQAVDQATNPWGIKVTRYEIKDISPTDTIEKAMEQQMRAEREKRAGILASEGERSARINVSKGYRQDAINRSLGEKQRRINVSEGKAQAIEIVSKATAEGLGLIAEAISRPQGDKAVTLQLLDAYVTQLGHILNESELSVMPADLASLRGIVEVLGLQGGGGYTGSKAARPAAHAPTQAATQAGARTTARTAAKQMLEKNVEGGTL